MSKEETDSDSSTTCCPSIMSWLRKVKQLVQDTKPDTKRQDHHTGARKDNEMTTMAAAVGGKKSMRNGRGKPTRRISSSSSSNSDYVVIDKPGEQRHVVEKEGEQTNGSTSPSDCSSVTSESAAASHLASGKKIKCKSLANMPVAMNNATGIIHNNELIVGGGYTSSSGDNLLVHMYDSNFDIWSPLPPAPLKWSAVASLDNKLVLVGGKEPGIPTAGYTNKLSIFDKESKTWKFFSPSMQVARLSPVVLTYGGYLIVAGGSKGSLDYNAEIFDPEKRWWMIATPLPHKCFRHTSTTIDRVWYLLNQDSGHIYCADIPTFVKQSHDSDQHHLVDYVEDSPVEDPASLSSRQPVMKEMNEQNQTGVTILWRPIETQPPSKPFRITSIEGHLLALSHSKGVVTAHAYMAGSWEHVGKLPITATTASMAVDSTGQLYLFGGEGGGGQYSSKLTQVTLVSRDYKKPKLHVGLTTAPLIINQ